jgi:radical SAM protein with 4Fe4S-binding SPASM domain
MNKIIKIPILRKFIKKNIYNLYYRSKLQDPEFPPEVWIENTNCCNARCKMCPRDKHTRQQGFMRLELFTKIIKEIAQYKDKVKRVHLHNFGEPLLDRDLPSRIKIAKEQGIKHVYFVTNASLLNSAKSETLIKSGLDEFKISFYGTEQESYNNTMVGLDFNLTINNVREFFKMRQQLRSKKPRVIIQYLPQESNKNKIDEFKAIFAQLIDLSLGDQINIFSLHNFANGRKYHDLGRNICTICDYPWRTMVILWDGKVVPCCLDYNGVQVLGDVNKESIKEIWNGKDYKKLREDFRRLDYRTYPLCLNCERTR